MKQFVLDASVVIKWLTPYREKGTAEARRLRTQHARGELWIAVPGLLFLEILNVVGRSWGWGDAALVELVGTMERFGLEVVEPSLPSVAVWVARGLRAYDASYVALAEERAIPLVTDDRTVLRLAGEIARPLIPPTA